MIKDVSTIVDQIQKGRQIDADDARWIAREAVLDELLCGANKLRKIGFGNRVSLCSIINAKSGRCSEDCAYCAQSAHHRTETAEYPFVEGGRIADAFREAARNGSKGFGIVTSGGTLSRADIEKLCETVGSLRQERYPYLCASLGMVSAEEARALKGAGVRRFHHNLETSRSFFPRICTTHSYEQRVETVRTVKAAGLEVCSGCLFGLGESWDDRIELAMTLRELDVDSVPLNFLTPIPGTPLAGAAPLPPRDILRIIALYRMILPRKDIRICGGRERNLRDLHSWIFFAGASGMMIGNYLTTAGRSVEDDRRMIEDLGLQIDHDD
ncbi:MAG TPA: biotin synthase BioB [bacterium]|nr:biotin synthase BioB [bacterium]